jgi:hypothetical protein
MLLSPRFLQRLAATVGLFTRYGLADFAEQQGLRGLAREPEPEDHKSDDLAAAFRARLVELGPAFIKLGQVLSTRPDLLPPAYIEELSSLQDGVDPVPLDAVEQVIERELGAHFAADRAKRDLKPRRLFQIAAETGELAMAMPHRIDLISARLAANDFQFRVEIPQILIGVTALQKVANRVFSGLVLAGLLIASAMLIQYRRALGTAGFLLAGIVGLWMVLAIVWSDH